jgi:ribose/xylose/arabinose/galactoside ABC-type transport system permease subunit
MNSDAGRKSADPRMPGDLPGGAGTGWIRKLSDFAISNGLLVALIVFVLAVGAAKPSILRWSILEGIIRQTTDIGVVVFPLALLVIVGSVDLSVGSVAGLSGIVMASSAAALGFPAGVLIGLALGLAIGALNGLLVSYLKLNPVVATLGGLALWRGVALLVTNAKTIGMGIVPEVVLDFGTGLRQFLFLPVHFYILLFVYVLCWALAHKHKFGERLFAVGGDERTAFLTGINVRLVKLIAHVLTGLGASVAGLMMFIRSGAVHGSDGNGLEFGALTIVLLGGISFQGGQGKMRGVIVALFFMSFLRHSLVLLKTPLYLQYMSSGVLIIVALYVDAMLTRRAELGKRA